VILRIVREDQGFVNPMSVPACSKERTSPRWKRPLQANVGAALLVPGVSISVHLLFVAIALMDSPAMDTRRPEAGWTPFVQETEGSFARLSKNWK
jgi:hypothetical protein